MREQIWAFDQVSKEELLKRIDSLKDSMVKNQIDFGVLFENVDKFYFTATIQKGMVVVPVAGAPLFFVEKSIERARMESPLDIIPIGSDKEIRSILEGRGILGGVAGLELDVLPVSVFERLKRIVGFSRYADLSPPIRQLRMVKSPFELTQIRKSGQMITQVFEAAKEVVREGAREIDIDAALVARGRKLGHQGVLRMRGINQEMVLMTVQSGFTGAMFSYGDVPIAGAGVTPAVPGGSSLKRVERGIPVTIDYGGAYNGYITDETRILVVGELNERFKKPYDCAKEIIEDVMSNARAGVDCRDVYSRAYRTAEKAGLTSYFMGHGKGQVSFLGHGVGLEINELPVITGRHEQILQEGMVVAIEPKFILPGEGAVGIELDFIIHKQGVERVTDYPFEIVSLP